MKKYTILATSIILAAILFWAANYFAYGGSNLAIGHVIGTVSMYGSVVVLLIGCWFFYLECKKENTAVKVSHGNESSMSTALGVSQGMINVVKFLIALSLSCAGVMLVVNRQIAGVLVLVVGLLVFLDVRQTEQRLASALTRKK